MLHGFSLDHRMMVACMEPVFRDRPGWRRIYLDMPGMGSSRVADGVASSDEMLRAVLEFIDKVVPGEDFAIAGESYGGYIARGIVRRRPQSVRGVLLICPMIIAEDSERRVPTHRVIVKEAGLRTRPAEQGEMFRSIAVVQTAEHWKRFKDEIVPGTVAADWPFLERLKKEAYPFSFDVDGLPEAFEAPTLILTGRQDSVVGYQDALRILDLYPRATFAILDQAGHDLQIEQEQVFNSLVGEWLDRVGGNWALLSR
jgi:pimeloyl-ACP methyl ester carboxylesterase